MSRAELGITTCHSRATGGSSVIQCCHRFKLASYLWRRILLSKEYNQLDLDIKY